MEKYTKKNTKLYHPVLQSFWKTTTHFIKFLSMYLYMDSMKWSDVKKNGENM